MVVIEEAEVGVVGHGDHAGAPLGHSGQNVCDPVRFRGAHGVARGVVREIEDHDDLVSILGLLKKALFEAFQVEFPRLIKQGVWDHSGAPAN